VVMGGGRWKDLLADENVRRNLVALSPGAFARQQLKHCGKERDVCVAVTPASRMGISVAVIAPSRSVVTAITMAAFLFLALKRC